ncbi:MAG TPA: hypothetical protein VGS06_00615 [Streptosporangiaceae bacterium]|nr:hypothetical protein [Streptosporangiaceae bacterium]
MTMADFATSRANLAQARAAQAAAQEAAYAAQQQQAGLAAALQRLSRQADPADPAAAREREALNAQLNQAAEDQAAARQALAAAGRQARAAAEGFASFTDPREQVGLLTDGSPFALFPVRLETRFVTETTGTTADGPTSFRLLVRIYPDDCSIDTFEAMLSATELSNAQRYWQNIWRAGGIEADDRAAWADLVAAHGSGRAGYIADTYQPVNVADQPVKTAAADEILVIATQAPLDAAEAAAVGAYWSAVWAASGDPAAAAAAAAALDAAVGAARAAELLAAYVPFNLSDTPAPPATPRDIAVSTTFVVFPPDPPVKQAAWSQAPQLRQFPERFVVIGYVGGQPVLQAIGGLVTLPLDVGPDPSADPVTDPTSAIHPDNGDLYVPDQLRWMVDFDAALAAGLALSIPLTPEQARSGFDRLLVLGVQMATSETDGAAALEELLYHHQVGRSGLSLVPQGTPTHNTTGTGTGYTVLDNADESFDDRKNQPLFTPTTDLWSKRDGQWVAEALGIGTSLLTKVHASGGQDQMQARAMQRALWPATLGYWMDKMMTPVFGDDIVTATRWFCTRYVSGRGPVPALRIGGQPYGILPTTAFSRIGWLSPPMQEPLREPQAAKPAALPAGPVLAFLTQLYAVATTAGPDWTAMSARAAHVGGAGDPHQTLLDVVGLHPSSVEYYSRSAESISELFNVLNLWGFGPQFFQALEELALDAGAAALVRRLGYQGQAEPDLLQHLFLTAASQLTTVIDDQPLSETSPVRAYTTDGRNYLTWLIDAAKTSLDAVVGEQGFTSDVSPRALLYLYLRHALMLGYYDSAYGLYQTSGVLGTAELAALKPEAPFVHVAGTAPASESRFALLFTPEPTITSSPTMLVTDYITSNLATLTDAAGLADQLAALGVLENASTAQLERAFAEHVDLCGYRYDAWLLALVNYQLEQMRAAKADGEDATGGIYLGAYAWLEDLRPSQVQLQPAQLPPALAEIYAGGSPILVDPGNGGYVHAPSLLHARTAAILRSAYLSDASAANPQTLAVNLSSDRVRTALGVLEGIRNGQSLGALLGYRFERGLHDDYGLAEVDKFIYPMRKAFPLVADNLAPTATPPGVPIEAIEARNVLDGRKLVDQITSSGVSTYPFGLTTLPAATAAETAAISQTASGLLDVYDAIGDLALAEGVYQAAQGNFDRIAATLDAYTTGNFPPEPQVTQTPPSGVGLTHRVALHLQPGLAAPAGATPAAQAEPALDAWLGGVLPALDTVGCLVTWTDPVSAAAEQQAVTLADLGVRPIDVLDLVLPDDTQAMTQLDDRILSFVLYTAGPRPDASLAIQYRTAPPGGLALFDVMALVRAVKTLVTRSRPLRATDAVLANDATSTANAAVSLDRSRVATPKAALDSLASDITTFLATLNPVVADPVANRATILAQIDAYLDEAVSLLHRAAGFRLASAGWGFALDGRHSAIAALMTQVTTLLDRWNGRLADYDARIAAYDANPPATDDAAFSALEAAEILLTTSLRPRPATPALLRAALGGTRAAFVTRVGQFTAVLGTTNTSFSAILAELTARLPVTDVDPAGFDVAPLADQAVLLAADVSATLTSQLTQITARSTAIQAQLDLHDAAATASAACSALQAGAAALLGKDFQVIPEFTVAQTQADEWANAVAASTGGTLLSYLINTEGIDRPVDEWMYGVARVRPMIKAWETTTLLVEALRGPGDVPALLPVQFPYQAGASWVAMQFDPADRPDSDRLCYTACYAVPFDKSAPQCGLLVDEWTEVIPATDHTTGITFNFDRPDNEAPQAILLVTPATASGTWQWDDLVGALNETLDLAKVRAVEPADIDQTPYSMLVPATITASTMYGISVVTSLAAVNGMMRQLGSSNA